MAPQVAIGQLVPTKTRGAWCAGTPLIEMALRLSCASALLLSLALCLCLSVSVSVSVSVSFSMPLSG